MRRRTWKRGGEEEVEILFWAGQMRHWARMCLGPGTGWLTPRPRRRQRCLIGPHTMLLFFARFAPPATNWGCGMRQCKEQGGEGGQIEKGRGGMEQRHGNYFLCSGNFLSLRCLPFPLFSFLWATIIVLAKDESSSRGRGRARRGGVSAEGDVDDDDSQSGSAAIIWD